MSIKFFQLSEVRKDLKVMYFLFEEVDFPVLLSSPSYLFSLNCYRGYGTTTGTGKIAPLSNGSAFCV